MRSFRHILFPLIIVSLFSMSETQAQCLNFAKTKGFTELDTSIYVPEGRLNALPLSEGDKMDVYKAFFRGRTYKVVVVGADNMPPVEFKVSNFQREVLFDSSKKPGSNSWTFESESNQNLIISVKVPPASSGGKPKQGCIAVIVGFEE